MRTTLFILIGFLLLLTLDTGEVQIPDRVVNECQEIDYYHRARMNTFILCENGVWFDDGLLPPDERQALIDSLNLIQYNP